MFELYLDNGLPAKPFKFVDHFDDYEETKEYNWFNFKLSKPIKMLVIDINEIKDIGSFEKINFVNNQLWIESKQKHIVCERLSKKTIDFIKKNKFVVLGFFETNKKGDTIKTLKRKIDII